MPLQQTYTYQPTGAVFNNACQIVTAMAVDVVNDLVTITVGTFVDVTTFLSGKMAVGYSTYVCSGEDFVKYFDVAVLTLAGHDPLTQAYQFLMSLPDFVSAQLVAYVYPAAAQSSATVTSVNITTT